MIDRELASFLEEGIPAQLATRNERLEPDGTRVIAAAVEADGRHLIAYIPERASPRLLPQLETSGQVAVVFSRPPDERSCQVKGRFVGARPARADEQAFVQAQWDRCLERLASIGFARATFGHWSVWPCTAVRLQVEAIFNQTPGPGAGAPLA